jgi:hypothetical protein
VERYAPALIFQLVQRLDMYQGVAACRYPQSLRGVPERIQFRCEPHRRGLEWYFLGQPIFGAFSQVFPGLPYPVNVPASSQN